MNLPLQVYYQVNIYFKQKFSLLFVLTMNNRNARIPSPAGSDIEVIDLTRDDPITLIDLTQDSESNTSDISTDIEGNLIIHLSF